MGTIKEVSGAALPYLFIAAALAGLYLFRDQIAGWFGGLMPSIPNPLQAVQDVGYDAGIAAMGLTDQIKCALGDAGACARVDWVNAGSPSVTPTAWEGNPEDIAIGPMSLLPSGLLAALYGPATSEPVAPAQGPTIEPGWEDVPVEPPKPITGPVSPSLDPWSMPDLVPYEAKYGDIVAGFSPYTTNFNIIAEKDDLLLFRSDYSWGIIDTSLQGIGGEPGKQIAAGSRGSGIPYGMW
jgi:hypothetical protein